MKKYDVSSVQPRFKHPVYGRPLLFLAILVSPFLFLGTVIADNWKDYWDELKDASLALVSPWEDKSKKQEKGE